MRPTVSSAEQWGFRLRQFILYALRNGRFRGGKHDTDLLPKGHPSILQEPFEVKVQSAVNPMKHTTNALRKIGELIEEDGME